MRRIRRAAAMVALVLVATLVGAVPASATGGGQPQPPPRPQYYLALGDSLTVGAQPDSEGWVDTGYPEHIRDRLDPGGSRLELVHLGCGGETARSMVLGSEPDRGSCGPPGFYDWWYETGTQLGDTLQFLRRHRGQVRLITLTIGANDLLAASCVGNPDPTCNDRPIADMGRALRLVLFAIRLVAPTVPIVGMTYYNPYAAAWLLGPENAELVAGTNEGTAKLNAELRRSYRMLGGRVADVAGAFSTGDLTTIVDSPFGPVPKQVARICEWTWMCAPPPMGPDIHANDAGYVAIAEAYLAQIRH